MSEENPSKPQRPFSWQSILVLVLAFITALLIWQWINKNIDSGFSLDAFISIGKDKDSSNNDSDTPKEEKIDNKYVGTYYEGVARFRENGKYGFIRRDGKVLVEAQFDNADIKFEEGMAWIKKGKKFGFISQEKWGEVVIPIEYDDAERFKEGFARVKKGEKFGKINPEGKAYGIDFPMEDILDDDFFRNRYEKIGELIATPEGQLRAKVKKRNGLWGFVDEEGDLIIDTKYESTGDFQNNLVWVEKDNLYGMIDSEGALIIPINYEEIFPEDKFIESFIRVKKDGKYGFINQEGELLTPPIYDEAGLFKEGMAYVKNDGKYGFVDRTGELTIPTIYDEIQIYDEYYGFQKGRAKMRVGNRWGYVYRDGREWWFD